MENLEKTKIPREERATDLIKSLYKVYLADVTVSPLSYAVFLTCEAYLTEEERETCEKDVIGISFNDWLKRMEYIEKEEENI